MEVSLRKAGYAVTTARSGSEALTKASASPPDLIVSDTAMPGVDGFELCSQLKSDMRLREIPFLFLTRDGAVESKVRGLQLGAEDYLIRPIYTRELITRVSMILGRRAQEAIKRPEARRRFFGDLANMGVVDLIQAMEVGRKNGTLRIEGNGLEGSMWFIDGHLVDANAGALQGEEAVYRMLAWERGAFEVDFRSPERLPAISQPTQAVLMEGMRRIDEWARITEQLPPLDSVMQVDYGELAARLGDLPDEVNALLRLFDGRRTVLQVIDASGKPDVEAVMGISRLYFEGILYRSPDRTDEADADTEVVSSMDGASASVPPPAPSLADELLRSVSEEPPAQPPETASPAEDDLSRPPPPPPEAFETASDPAEASPMETGPSLWDLTASVREKVSERDAKSASTVSLEMALLNEDDDDFPEFEEPVPTGDRDGTEDGFFADGVNLGQMEAESSFEFGETSPTTSTAQKLVFGMLVTIVVIGLGYLILKDEVTPINAPREALHATWHEQKLKARGPVAASAALDAGWRIPSEPDGGIEPEAPGIAAAFPGGETQPGAEGPGSDEPADGEGTTGTDELLMEAPEISPEADKKARALTAQGLELYKKGNFESAVAKFEKALSIAPGAKSALVAYTKGLLELEGRLPDALEAAEKSARLDAKNSEVYLLLGNARQDLGLDTESIVAYEQYLELDPKGVYASEVRQVVKGLRANAGR
jgi:CheY-like chemotaxis protein